MADKVLVVDDEPAIVELLSWWLTEAGYEVIGAQEGRIALKEFFAHHPHLAVIDIRMPFMDGYQLSQRIREVSDIPIFFLTALAGEDYKVRGLKIGGDDYLVKPISRREFLARVEAALRRYRMTPVSPAAVYSDPALRIDFERHQVFAWGEPVALTPSEFIVLSLLTRNANKLVTWEQLAHALEQDATKGYGFIKWLILSLRRRLEKETTKPKLIITVRGFGYRYVPPAVME